MLARVLSTGVNGIEAFQVEVAVSSVYGDTIIVIILSLSAIPNAFFLKMTFGERPGSFPGPA